MKTAFVIFFILPVVIWIFAAILNRRHIRRTETALDSCECSTIVRRAERMHNAVATKIAAMDSRNPDNPLPPLKNESEPPTKEVPPIGVFIILLSILWGA